MTSGEPPSAKPDLEEAAACRRRALDLLARREHGRRELERKLLARGHAAAVVAATLDSLESSRLLATDRFAESFIRARVAKGQGPVRIRAELAERGVDGAAEFLAAQSVDWAALARQVRAKRFGAAPPVTFKERARQASFLRYRGFEERQITAALDLAEDSD